MRAIAGSSVECRVCGRSYRSLVPHLPTHGLNGESYRERFPDAPLVSGDYENVRTSRISRALTGRHLSAEHRRNVSLGLPRGPSPRRSAAMRGLVKSPEHRRHLSEAQRGKVKAPDHMRKLWAGHKRWRTENRDEFMENMLRAQKFSRYGKNTKPELALARILDELGVGYETQARVRADRLTYRVFDFIVPSRFLVIEADGCYWHGCGECYPDRSYSSRAESNSVRDVIGCEALVDLGWRVARFWEHDIMKRSSWVKGQLSSIMLSDIEEGSEN